MREGLAQEMAKDKAARQSVLDLEAKAVLAGASASNQVGRRCLPAELQTQASDRSDRFDRIDLRYGWQLQEPRCPVERWTLIELALAGARHEGRHPISRQAYRRRHRVICACRQGSLPGTNGYAARTIPCTRTVLPQRTPRLVFHTLAAL
jgi:hypothetical protein